MNNLTVKFIGKEYSIPEDVLTYIDLLDFTDSVQKQLTSAFVRKLRNELDQGNAGCLDDKVMASDIEQQVGKFIAKLTEHDIYDRTINDYLCKNEGYKLISKVNAAALDEAKRLLKQEMTDWLEGYEDALHKKEASVTGLGFSIWSGSFVNHAIYAAMEASKVNEQEKAAIKEYQKDMAELDTRLESRKSAEEKQYLSNTYIPNMEAAITVFSYELLDTFISDLIKTGKLNTEILNYIHIDRSNDLLKNLEFSQNKSAVLLKAFEACPYNIAVYMQALKYDLLDYDSFQTAKVFKRDDYVISFFRENWGKVSYPTKFNINYQCVNVWAALTGKSTSELLYALTEQYATGIVKAYSRVADMLTNNQLCRRVIEDCGEDEVLKGDAICKSKAYSYVSTIVTPVIWSQLVEKCGHTGLLEKVIEILPVDGIFTDKNAVDSLLIGGLEKQLENARQQLIPMLRQKEQENLIKAQEEEIARIKWSQQCKRVHRICKFILIVLIIIPLLLRFVLVGMWCNDVKLFVAENIETQLKTELLKFDSIATKMGLTGEYEINGFEYYKAEYTKSITIVPHVTVYSNKRDNFYSSQGFVVLDYLQGRETKAVARPWYIANDEHNPSVNFYMTVICSDGSKEVCYENYEEDDTRFFVYMPIGFSILFILYSSVVVLAIKKVIKKYTC